MTENNSEISCYLTHLLLQFSKRHSLKNTLNAINVPEKILDNPHEWTAALIWTKMAENIEQEYSQDPNVIFNLGKDFFNQENKSFLPFFLRIAPLKMILRSLSNYSPKHSIKIIDITFKVLEKNKVLFEITPTRPEHFSRQMCDFNRGATYAILSLKGFDAFEITEKSCAPRNGARSCQHIISWKASSNPFHRLKIFFSSRLRERNAIINRLEENHLALQKQYQEILSMRDFYSHIMDSMGEAVIWLKPDRTIDFINQAFCQLVGKSEEDILGQPFESFFNDSSNTSTFNHLCTTCIKLPMIPYETEFLFESKKAAARSGQTTVIWVPSGHRPAGFLISIRDITETRQIERQLSAAENRYRSLYENSPALIIAVNMKGMFLYANPTMTEQSGYTERELKRMHFKQLVAPQANYNIDYLIENLLNQPTRLQEVHFKTKNGEWKCIALNTYHIYEADGKTLAGIAGIGIDITETKRLNEQVIKSQRMELLGQLAGGMAHDFGNILTSISGFSKLIMSKSVNEKISQYARSIERSGKRAHDLVKNLLAFSRGDNRKSVVFNVVEIAEEVKDMLVGVVPKMIKLESEWPDAPCHIKGDPGKIHQCILNLGINARDAIGLNTGKISIRVLRKPEHIKIQVEDTGSGIPPDIIENIFDPFFSTKQKKSGTGLGLSVVYGIIKSHDGDIHVDSHPGEGTTFTLVFPSANAEGYLSPSV